MSVAVQHRRSCDFPRRRTEASICAVLQVPEWSSAEFRDLAPEIFRQRLVIEGTPASPVTDRQIRDYLRGLSAVCEMTVLTDPVTHRSDRYGWAGWIHWETSGAHFYAWERPRLFFSVDIYTCKPFEPAAAADFTHRFFDAHELAIREW
jgi:S-adenosylmethionine decarboxylase